MKTRVFSSPRLAAGVRLSSQEEERLRAETELYCFSRFLTLNVRASPSLSFPFLPFPSLFSPFHLCRERRDD